MVVTVENRGTIVIELNTDKAPKAAKPARSAKPAAAKTTAKKAAADEPAADEAADDKNDDKFAAEEESA